MAKTRVTNQYFGLTLDQVAPIDTALTVTPFIKSTDSKTVTLTVGDASYMRVWVDQTESPSAAPETATYKAAATSATPDGTYVEGTNYVHVIFYDATGNYTPIGTKKVVVDDHAPTTTVTITEAKTKEVAITPTFAYSDAQTGLEVSLVDYLLIGGDLDFTVIPTGCTKVEGENYFKYILTTDDVATPEESGSRQIQVTLKALTAEEKLVGEAQRTVLALAHDQAGNTTALASAGSDTVILDTVEPEVSANLYKTDKETLVPTITNEDQFYAKVEYTGQTADVVGYKIWGNFASTTGSSTDTSKPDNYTAVTEGTNPIWIDGNMFFTTGDGTKTVYIELVDEVGNTKQLTLTRKYDTGAPSVTLAITAPSTTGHSTYKVISAVEGFNKTSWTIDATDDNYANNIPVSFYRIKSGTSSEDYVLELIESLTGTATEGKFTQVVLTNKTFAELTKNMTTPVASQNIRLLATVQDEAGNIGYSNEIYVELDTVGPTATFGTIALYSNITTGNYTNEATAADPEQNTVYYQYAFIDGNSTASIPADYESKKSAYSASGISVAAADLGSDGGKFIHVVYEDIVGNKTITTSAAQEIGGETVCSFVYDTHPATPVITRKTAGTGAVTSRNYAVTIDADDSNGTGVKVSGARRYKIYGDIYDNDTDRNLIDTAAKAEWSSAEGSTTFPTDKSVVLTLNTTTSGSENKTLYVMIEDLAGNITTNEVIVANAHTVTLETDVPSINASLLKSDKSAELPDPINKGEYVLKFQSTDEPENVMDYKVWGTNTTGATTEGDAVWTTYQVVSAEDPWMYLSLVFTAPTEAQEYVYTATVNVKTRDENGNESQTVTLTRTYDINPPMIQIYNGEGSHSSTTGGALFSVVSKQTTQRRDSTGALIEKTRDFGDGEVNVAFNNNTYFEFTTDEALVAWKVCVNDGSTEQEDIADMPAIGTANGSINMSGTTLDADATVKCLLKAADFAATTIVNDTDGVYEVVVFGQDESGNWSAGHAFTVPAKSKATATDESGNPVTIVSSSNVAAAVKSAAPSGSIVMQYAAPSGVDLSDTTLTITADVSDLDLAEGDTVDVYHYEEE